MLGHEPVGAVEQTGPSVARVARRASPGRVVTHHHGGLDDAPGLYQRFDRREDGVVKAVLYA